LYSQTRFSEAEAEFKAAQELAPLSPGTYYSRTLVLFLNRDYDGVIGNCKKALELQPEANHIRAYLVRAYALKGMFAEAFKEVEAIGNSDPFLYRKLKVYVDGLAGKTEEAQQTLRELEHLESARLESPYEFAIIYASAGDKDKALASVEEAVGSGKIGSKAFLKAMFRQDPQLDSLRSDVRFTQYVARLER
ncbi:MAG TPA: hypothetical protein VJS37_18555, partial [Terriglobales bacterium]|nr:hypothetical protein [Terriglobales bacterium]